MSSLQTKTKKKNLLKMLEQMLGNVSASCTALGISRRTHYNWMQEDPEYAEEVLLVQEHCIDFVESKLFENIEKNKEASIIFYLKTKAKHRGYQEIVEIKPVLNEDSIESKDIDELETYARQLLLEEKNDRGSKT